MIILIVVVAASGGYAFYKYRIQVWLLQVLVFLALVFIYLFILEFIVDVFVEINYVQRYMDSEIRAIMAQYMPLDNQPEESNQVHHNI